MTLEDVIAFLEPEWKSRSLCRKKNLAPESFFPPENEWQTAYKLVRPICWACEVRTDCLGAVMDSEAGKHFTDRFGFQGGLTPRERWRLWREQQAA